ncbi:MAG: DUF177 domain-containing protein [Oscillospiraceae bacterium]|nr:DUF177 domain-containing protein [Oscillospiraceae bacterium]
MSFDTSFSLGEDPFFDEVRVEGCILNRGGVVTLEAKFSTVFDFECHRCLEKTSRRYTGKTTRTLVLKLDSDEDTDLLLLPDAVLDLPELIREEMFLQLPSLLLCRDDCKGLCHQCGANLNVGECSCTTPIDPRLEKLASIIDN